MFENRIRLSKNSKLFIWRKANCNCSCAQLELSAALSQIETQNCEKDFKTFSVIQLKDFLALLIYILQNGFFFAFDKFTMTSFGFTWWRNGDGTFHSLTKYNLYVQESNELKECWTEKILDSR